MLFCLVMVAILASPPNHVLYHTHSGSSRTQRRAPARVSPVASSVVEPTTNLTVPR